MNSAPEDLMTPRILIVDDEKQIHASLKLRLNRDYELVFCFNAREAVAAIARDQFDLCFVDIHMPKMDGLSFIDAARKSDPELGVTVLSAFDTDENLRRTIPLQVYDFVPKPLPERDGFEARIPDWVEQTRQRRRLRRLAEQADRIANDRDIAQLEREIELIASETAREALLQTANLLTTIQAHIASASTFVASKAKSDAGLAHLLRSLNEAHRTADTAVTVTEGFFESAYGNRESSPALVNEGLRDAMSIAVRISQANDSNKALDFSPADGRVSLRELSGIQFLLMVVPVIAAALILAEPNTTVRILSAHCPRLDAAARDPRWRSLVWINRRNSLGSQAGVAISITTSTPPLARVQMEAWLKGEYPPFSALTQRGLIAGVKKCRGLLGFALPPQCNQFGMVLALPA